MPNVPGSNRIFSIPLRSKGFFPLSRKQRLRFVNAAIFRICTIILCFYLLNSIVAAQYNSDFELEEIAEGIFVHPGKIALMNAENQGGIANIGAVIGKNAVAIVDTGGSEREGVQFKAALRRITQLPLRYVINTHEHPDHFFGNGAFDAPSVTFIGHKNLPRAIAQRGDFYRHSFIGQMGEALLAGVRLIPPEVTVEDEMRLDLGGRVIVLQAWPVMHSDCDLTVFDLNTQTLFAGDLVFLEHIPVIDGSLLGWIRNLDRLAAIPARIVIPGHGQPSAPWPQALEPERRYFNVLAQDLRAMIAKGEDVGHGAKEAGQSEAQNWQLFEDYNSRNATAAYAEIEWE